MLSISLELLLVPQHFERIHFRGEVCGQDARHKRNANQSEFLAAVGLPYRYLIYDCLPACSAHVASQMSLVRKQEGHGRLKFANLTVFQLRTDAKITSQNDPDCSNCNGRSMLNVAFFGERFCIRNPVFRKLPQVPLILTAAGGHIERLKLEVETLIPIQYPADARKVTRRS